MARPKLKIEKEPIDNFLEIIALVGLAILIIYPMINYAALPEKIPTHFDGAGNPDAFGKKSSIALLPIVGVFIYVIFYFIQKVPHTFNYGGLKITKENAAAQYQNVLRIMRILKALMTIAFAYMTWSTVQIAMGNNTGLGKGFTPLFLILVLGSIGFGMYKTYTNK